MKIKNVFKKTNEKNLSNNIQKLEKTQLEKIVGGTETETTTTTDSTDRSINDARKSILSVIR